MLSNNDIQIIVNIINTGNDVLLDDIIDVINASLLCKEGGKVVRRSPKDEKEIQAKESARRKERIDKVRLQ